MEQKFLKPKPGDNIIRILPPADESYIHQLPVTRKKEMTCLLCDAGVPLGGIRIAVWDEGSRPEVDPPDRYLQISEKLYKRLKAAMGTPNRNARGNYYYSQIEDRIIAIDTIHYSV